MVKVKECIIHIGKVGKDQTNRIISDLQAYVTVFENKYPKAKVLIPLGIFALALLACSNPVTRFFSGGIANPAIVPDTPTPFR